MDVGRNMTFKDKTFNDRINDEMWYHSEKIFEEKWPGLWAHAGLGEDDTAMASWMWSPMVAHMPDYRAALTAHTKPFWVEVQGTGTNASVRSHKFKQKKLDNLGLWNSKDEVTFWLWDDKTETAIWTSYASIRMMIGQGYAEQGLFDGKRPYWAIPVPIVEEHKDTERLRARYGS